MNAVIPLDPDKVRTLNALGRGGAEAGAAVELVREARDQSLRWLARESAFSMDDEEAATLQQIGVLWQQIDEVLGAAPGMVSPIRLLPLLFAAWSGQAVVTQERARNPFSDVRVLDDLLKAGAAVVMGRGEARAVRERWPQAQAWLDGILDRYAAQEKKLQPEVRADLEPAFAAMQDGLAAARVAADDGDRDGLRDALESVRAADAVLAHFTRWEKQEPLRLSTTSHFRIPEPGSRFRDLLEGVREGEAGWPLRAREAYHVHFQPLGDACRRQAETRLLPAQVRATALAAIEETLRDLSIGLEALAAGQDEAADALETGLTRLAATMTVLERHAFSCDGLHTRRTELYWELLRALQEGTVPNVALLQIMRETPQNDAWIPVLQILQEYMEQPDGERLCEAAELVLAMARTAEPDDDLWLCPACGYGNYLAEKNCGRCGLETVTPRWNALG